MRHWSKLLLLTVVLILGNTIASSRTRQVKMQHGKTTVISLRYLPDGERAVSASYAGTVVMWDLKSSKPVWRYDLDAASKSKTDYTISNILGMDLSSDGSVVAVSYHRNNVVRDTIKGQTEFAIALLDGRSGQLQRVLNGHTDLIGEVAFSANGEFLVSESGDSTARLWKVKSGQEVLQIKLKEKGAAVAFSGTGKFVSVATQPVWGLPPQPIVGLYDVSNGELVREFTRRKNAVTGLAFSPDGRLLAIAVGDAMGAQLDVWHLDSEAPRISVPMPGTVLKKLAFSDDGRLLAIGGYGNGRGVVEIRDLGSNKVLQTTRFDAKVTALDFDRARMQLLIGTDDGQIILVQIPPK